MWPRQQTLYGAIGFTNAEGFQELGSYQNESQGFKKKILNGR